MRHLFNQGEEPCQGVGEEKLVLRCTGVFNIYIYITRISHKYEQMTLPKMCYAKSIGWLWDMGQRQRASCVFSPASPALTKCAFTRFNPPTPSPHTHLLYTGLHIHCLQTAIDCYWLPASLCRRASVCSSACMHVCLEHPARNISVSWGRGHLLARKRHLKTMLTQFSGGTECSSQVTCREQINVSWCVDQIYGSSSSAEISGLKQRVTCLFLCCPEPRTRRCTILYNIHTPPCGQNNSVWNTDNFIPWTNLMGEKTITDNWCMSYLAN